MRSAFRRLAAVALAAALAACGQHRAAPPPAGPAPVAVAPAAPGWSAGEIRSLQGQLRSALGASALATSGLAVVDAQGRALFGRRERIPATPASSLKVLVGAAALQTLGPQYRFATTLETLTAPTDGAVRGDLYLVGGGDPTLTRDDLRAGAAAAARAGLRAVSGDVVGDGTAFAAPEINPGWDPDDLQYGYAAGTSALSLDQGTVEFHLVPAAAGAPARIVTLPPSSMVRVLGGIITAYGTLFEIRRDPRRNDFRFSGRLGTGAEQSFWRPVVDLSRYAADVARTMLRSRGVEVRGGARAGIAPVAPYVLWRHRSAPLRVIVAEMLFDSNNHFAEQLLRALGATRGAPSETGGAAVERAMLAHEGVPQAGLHVIDASGLAPGDRIAPLTLATLLAKTASEPIGPAFVRSLPRVGIEGTVRYHHLTGALGRARAKSGHIENVNALAGYVVTARHGRVAFAFIVNDWRAEDGRVYAGIDRALDILAGS
jgi:D-alanyl-D-alanine carboxypeptidase/D-alanyl-D-alanine-endopeptidase (penicillin-binding protein 4)